ncbi:ABC transporter ATP-binding protein [Natronobacterium gregoryi]|uniref:ABC transporter n=2 Tax=Natronobacterium gregoryi TaxID=44930 RepID=L0AHI6_NATGS|nr:ABC transporter ATP-binding protein [Natronobacterium gregoryi]AFZ72530.1 ABC-type multidrug transport system, ATPase and permease component [Natronobacterium gregoryi SP2]ELY74403.1 ABC transporter [Natronobacterium gregoryi SP2]PLK21499.1 ABC transporter ATP-binding protein [Natronobacterium gregoryi SP2]SFI76284.1 ATP-binding cassette, subfamily B [Natronobacterium gregoryi]
MDGVDWDKDDPFEEQREEVESPMRRLLFEYGRPYWFSVTVGLVSSVFARALDLLPALLLAVAIDSIFGNQVFAEQVPLVVLPEAWLPASPDDQFWFVVIVIAGSFAFGAIFHWLRNWGFNSFSQSVQHDVRTATYDKMQRLDMEFFANKQTGEMMSVLSNDVNQLERFLNEGMNSATRLIVMVVGITGLLFWLNPQLALVSLAPVPLIAVFTYVFVKKIQPKYAAVRSSVGKVNSRLENNLGGINVIKSSNTEEFESDRVEDVSRKYYDKNWDAIWLRIKFFPGLQLISGIGFVLTFLVGGYWVFTGAAPGPFTGTLETGVFVAFIMYTQQLVWPMAQFGQVINMYQRAEASSERIFGLMDEEGRIERDEEANELEVYEGRVEYRRVSFGYDESERIIDDISFEADGGDTVALVGPTGAGKSTVLKLLLRLYDVDEGEIRIDGQDVRNVSLSSLRRKMGYVGQDTFLFYGTVEENITYGAFDADHEEVVEAAKMAEAHDFIQNLPDGYDTEVGERGVKLSGGQRQRISIARAILKDPDILVLDEATSDVDTETEMLIQRSIDELAEDRTTFAIAHRLSTIKDADTILVLEGGAVVERGTHEELLENEGLYSHLWGVQAGEIDELPQEFIERAQRRQARTGIDVDAGDDD